MKILKNKIYLQGDESRFDALVQLEKKGIQFHNGMEFIKNGKPVPPPLDEIPVRLVKKIIKEKISENFSIISNWETWRETRVLYSCRNNRHQVLNIEKGGRWGEYSDKWYLIHPESKK